MLVVPLVWAVLSGLAHALGEPKAIGFPSVDNDYLGLGPSLLSGADGSQTAFSTSKHSHKHKHRQQEWWPIVSAEDEYVVPFLLDSKDDIAIHLAANVLARDIHTITGYRPIVYNDTLPANVSSAVIVGSVGSEVVGNTRHSGARKDELEGKWESYDARIVQEPLNGLDSALVITGSDRVSPHFPVARFRTSPSASYSLCTALALALIPHPSSRIPHPRRTARPLVPSPLTPLRKHGSPPLTHPARHSLRPLHPLGTDGRLALPLLGRRAHPPPLGYRIQHRRPHNPRRADGQVPRPVHQRRAPGHVDVGEREVGCPAGGGGVED